MFPTTVVAAYGIGVRIFSVIFLPAIAVARGVETMTGQNVGAEKPGRAGSAAEFAALVTFVVLSGLGAVAFVFTRPIVAVFTTDPEVVRVGVEFLRWVAPSFGFIGVMRAYTWSFRGAGKTLVAAAISVVILGAVRIPAAYVASLSRRSGDLAGVPGLERRGCRHRVRVAQARDVADGVGSGAGARRRLTRVATTGRRPGGVDDG